jgi:hypothetical protein
MQNPADEEMLQGRLAGQSALRANSRGSRIRES